ncbi:MAG: 5-(carboxyamino)imidazole ribonucleotide mutase [Acidobacteriia bacterium]|nr:5-(carboxyamino)imidazole ribonucleotide mutase [Terriglobia bacterium]
MSADARPKVAILMGSDSDLPAMAEAARALESLSVPYEIEVTSAHRTPERTAEIVHSARSRGVRVFVVGAGGAAHLAGTVAAHTTLPVLGVPLPTSELRGLDALLATVQMPAGIPVGTLAIGPSGAANAAILAAEILALADPDLAERLASARREMAVKVETRSLEVREKLSSILGRTT